MTHGEVKDLHLPPAYCRQNSNCFAEQEEAAFGQIQDRRSILQLTHTKLLPLSKQKEQSKNTGKPPLSAPLQSRLRRAWVPSCPVNGTGIKCKYAKTKKRLASARQMLVFHSHACDALAISDYLKHQQSSQQVAVTGSNSSASCWKCNFFFLSGCFNATIFLQFSFCVLTHYPGQGKYGILGRTRLVAARLLLLELLSTTCNADQSCSEQEASIHLRVIR